MARNVVMSCVASKALYLKKFKYNNEFSILLTSGHRPWCQGNRDPAVLPGGAKLLAWCGALYWSGVCSVSFKFEWGGEHAGEGRGSGRTFWRHHCGGVRVWLFFSQITYNLISYRTKCATATSCKCIDCCLKDALCDVMWVFKVTVIDSGSNSVAVLSLNTDIQIVEDSALQVEQWVFLHRVLTASDASECLQQNQFD